MWSCYRMYQLTKAERLSLQSLDNLTSTKQLYRVRQNSSSPLFQFISRFYEGLQICTCSGTFLSMFTFCVNMTKGVQFLLIRCQGCVYPGALSQQTRTVQQPGFSITFCRADKLRCAVAKFDIQKHRARLRSATKFYCGSSPFSTIRRSATFPVPTTTIYSHFRTFGKNVYYFSWRCCLFSQTCWASRALWRYVLL